MERMEGKRNRRWRRHGALVCIVGILCLVYLFTTRTPETWRIIDAFESYCYAHYTVIERPTQENEQRLARYEAKLARLSEGKFDHRNAEEVRAFLEPRGYAYDADERDGRVDYLLAAFAEHGRFEASGSDSLSYDYFLLDWIYVVPYDHPAYGGFKEKTDRSSLIFYSRNGLVYINAAWVRWRFENLFNLLWESKVTRASKMEGPRHCKVLYRGVNEIWREACLFRVDEKGAKEYFVDRAFESYVPTMLGCVSRERYYWKRKLIETNGLELAYLRSLAENP
ncbi:MAG: hypothetical protein GTO13_00545, partial [Proteobacteria bacterium]|nr:hypothetical protein [Pseudomonadota bacterium]NIS59234.1 hypothetical protein [Pseudomonadota bacterium]